jgi:uncharacterized protein (TIGR02099 family)
MPATRAPDRATIRRTARALRVLRGLGTLLLYAFGAFCALLLLLRYVVLPQVPMHRDAISGFLSQRIGAPVTIDALATGWDGWNPKLVIDGFRLRERDGTQSVLELPHVELVVAWTSLAYLRLQLKELAIDQPSLAIARDTAGVIHVAGLEIDPDAGSERSPFLAWLLRQHEISVRDATLAWTDEQRAAPTITLEQVDVKLENLLGRHRFGATGVPPSALASPLDVRGDFAGIGAGNWRKARGHLYARLDYADVAAWRAWVPLPLPIDSGQGALRLWLDFSDEAVTSLVADAELADVSASLDDALPPLALQHVVGRLTMEEAPGRRTIGGRGISFTTESGTVQAPADFDLDLRAETGSAEARGTLAFTRADLAALGAIAAELPLPADWRAGLAAHAPYGAVTGGRLTWQGSLKAPSKWTARATLVDVGGIAHDPWPGVGRISGTLDSDESKGTLKLATRDGSVELPAELRDVVSFEKLDGAVRWHHDASGTLRVDVDDVTFANADAAGAISGSWAARAGGPGDADLKVQFARANVARIANYLPIWLSPHARDWARRALVRGDIDKGQIEIKGNLADFPFTHGKPGTFAIAADVRKATLDFAEGWPVIDGIDAVLKLDRTHLRVEAARGSVLDADIGRTVADIPDLAAPVLAIDGVASGGAPSFLAFLAQSPIAGWIGHVTDGVHVTGNGTLALSLSIPLADLASSRADGTFGLAAGAVDWPGAPPFRGVAGKFRFSRQGIVDGAFDGNALGGAARVTLARVDDGLHLHGSGSVDFAELRALYPVAFVDRLGGRSDWTFDGVPAAQGFDWTVRSSMQGATIGFPAPFAKAAAGALPVSVERRMISPTRDAVTIAVGSEGRVFLRRRLDGGDTRVDGVLVVAGRATPQPGDDARPGIYVRADVDRIDVDEWLAIDLPVASAAKPGTTAAAPLELKGVDLTATRLTAMGRRFRDLTIGARRDADHWNIALKGRDVEGAAAWYLAAPQAPNGRAVLRLTRVALPREDGTPKGEPDRTAPAPAKARTRWPEVDAEAERFISRGHELGTLKVRAKPQGDDWLIDALELANDGGTITAHGAWHVGSDGERTSLDATFDVKDAGVFLARFGYPDEIRGAPTKGTGHFTWPGAPSDFDYDTLDGKLAIATGAGQFLKIQPGIGRLLGVLSLQALPRRITLDFHDVFSEGFAFDEAKGDVAIVGGVMRTDGFAINGTAARITIRGEADLARETQALDVHVQPSLATGVSAGAAALLVAANPIVAAVVGAGTLLAQKVLKDPIEQMFSYEYRVTGQWSDPVVTRVGREPNLMPGAYDAPPPAAAPQKSAPSSADPPKVAPPTPAPKPAPPAATAPATPTR